MSGVPILSIIKQQVRINLGGYRIIPHILACALVLAAVFFQFKLSPELAKKGVTQNFLTIYGINWLGCLIGMTYSFMFLVVPFTAKIRKRSLFFLFFFGNMALWMFLKSGIDKIILLHYPVINALPDFKASFFFPASRIFIFEFMLFVTVYYFVDIYDHQQEIRRLEQYKTEKIALETNFLKSQINPHFLFNTLNNIYALSFTQTERAPEVIDRLKTLLHYMLYDCKTDYVALSDELQFAKSYIALEKLRHRDEQCEVTINVTGDVGSKKIAPLLLINFLENAFKHGAKAGLEKAWVKMDIDVKPHSVYFVLSNSKPAFAVKKELVTGHKGGIGVKNVKRRLEILYPRKHKLLLLDEPTHFEVKLRVDL